MKLRIKGNSIRLRLTQSEVDLFATTGYIDGRTEFGSSGLVYALRSGSDIQSISAGFNDNTIMISIPDHIKKEWVSTNKVGFDHKMDLNNGRSLFLLVEKDFVCLDNTLEDQSDNYPNPNSVC